MSVTLPKALYKDKEFLKFVDKEFGSGYTNGLTCNDDLNEGYCVLVAKFLKNKYLPKAKFVTIGNPMTYHVVLELNGKFYDAVDFDGVNHVRELSWSKANPRTILNPKDGIAYDG
jgi:hypothetical protein